MFAKELLVIVGSLWQCQNIVRFLFGVSWLGSLSWTAALLEGSADEILCLAEAC